MTSLAASSITRKTAISTEAAAVKDALVLKGLETPMLETGLTRDEKYLRIKAAMRDVVTTLGLDLSDDSLTETPHRIAKCISTKFSPDWITVNFPRFQSSKIRWALRRWSKSLTSTSPAPVSTTS